MSFALKRIYDQPLAADGLRILVDRIWPRGMTKEEARVELWLKEIAPSTELRKWFAHDPAKFAEFSKQYIEEVQQNPEAAKIIADWHKHAKVTLLYGAKDEADNEAIVLQKYLK